MVNEGVNLIQWQDKRLVSVLTTLHDDTPVQVERRSRHAPDGRETVDKPQPVIECNKYMGGIVWLLTNLSLQSTGRGYCSLSYNTPG